ncbi:MAG: hypothetical protein ABSE39_11690 [Candidatus Bathyarchaeia archaeon]|jgi:hypothetical protein
MKWHRSVTIATLVLVIALSQSGSARAAAAIAVSDHGFAKNFKWTSNGHISLINRTSTFTQDDARIYAYVKATFYTANLTWNWYDPFGQLYHSSGYKASCVASPCDAISSLQISGTKAATSPGLWRLDFLADGIVIYSDNFFLAAIVTQDNYWNFTIVQSSNPRIHGTLRVVLHPSNLTWSSYRIYMPYASNMTAYDYLTNQTLEAITYPDGRVVVNLGGPRSDGYSFILKFDVSYVLMGFGGGNYAFTWREYPWERFNDVHPIPETYSVNLPNEVMLLDAVGYNSMGLTYNVTTGTRLSLNFEANTTAHRFGWTILYRDLSVEPAANPNTPFGLNSGLLLPFLPLTLGSLSVWAAVMSVFLLTASELVSPIYSRGGYGILINRKRLRLAALLLVAIFMITITYQLASQHVIVQH